MICFAYQQGKAFNKFKKNRNYKNLAEQFKITKSKLLLLLSVLCPCFPVYGGWTDS